MDLLRQKARAVGLELVYTNNKKVFMSASIDESRRVLRVHRVFRGCSEGIAGAILGFYIQPEYGGYYSQAITSYVQKAMGISPADIILRPAVYTGFSPRLAPVPSEDLDSLPGISQTVEPRLRACAGKREIEVPIQAIFRVDNGSYSELASNKINVPKSQEIQLEIRVSGGQDLTDRDTGERSRKGRHGCTKSRK
ncbi:MAG: hypothetical protein ACOX4K_06485 [Bacillota bacterium]